MKKMSSILLVALCVILATGGASARSAAQPEPSASVHRPNIVLVLTDDQDLLLDSLDRGKRPLVSGIEARRIVEFIACLYKSAFTGQPVARGSITPGDPFYASMNGVSYAE